MGSPEINQMKQALIRQGVQSFKLEGLSEEQLRKMCNEKLSQSLTGNQNWGNTDGFTKQYKYNILYTLPSGEKVKVAKVADTVLPSGRKVETFVDIAGNQYFQYRASDNKVLDESYFRKQEKMFLGQGFKFVDNKLYRTDLMGNLSTVIDDKTEKHAFTKLPGIKSKETETKTFNLKDVVENNKVQYHPVYKDLMLDKHGKIDMEQFSIDFIKAKFSGDNYKIEYTTDELQLPMGTNAMLTVTTKDGQKVCELEYSDYSTSYRTFKNEKQQNYYNFNAEGLVTSCRHDEPDGSFVSYFYENDGKTLKEYKTCDKDGNNKSIIYKNNQIQEVWISKYNGKTFNIDKIIWYHNGKKYREKDCKTENFTNYLADNIHKNLTNRNNYGYVVIDKNVVNNILNEIDESNVSEVLENYKEKYNVDLEEQLFKGYGLDDFTRFDLLLHLFKVDSNNENLEKVFFKQLDKLTADSPQKFDSKRIEMLEDLILPDEDYKKAKLEAFKLRIAVHNKNIKDINKIIQELSNGSSIKRMLREYPVKKVLGVEPSHFLGEKIGRLIENYPKIGQLLCDEYSNFVSDIYKMPDVSKEEKQKIIESLIEKLQNSGFYIIANDMKSHITDEKKIKIDGMRILTSTPQKINDDEDDEESIKYNKSDFTGDINPRLHQNSRNCWLVGEIISMAEKEGGRKKLKELYTVNLDKEEITINLKEAKKTYTYKFSEVAERRGVLTGDLKAKAIAMAVNDYFRDNAYNKSSSTIEYDTEGNTGGRFFELAFGNSNSAMTFSMSSDSLNRKDRCYTLTYLNKNLVAHVIAITKADNKYVYYNDPSGHEGKMSWNEFKSKFGYCNYIQL